MNLSQNKLYSLFCVNLCNLWFLVLLSSAAYAQTSISTSSTTVVRSTTTVTYQEPKLAVATLVNTDATAEDNWVGMGLEELIQSRLSRLKGIKMVEKQELQKAINSLPYQRKSEEITQDAISLKAAKNIGLKYLITGSYQSRINRLTTKINLCDVNTDKILATISRERNPKDIFEMEKEIVLFIAKFLDELIPILGVDGIYSPFVQPDIKVKGMATTLMTPPQKAVEYYSMMVSMDPENPDMYFNLGNALLDLKEYAEAEKSFNQSLRLYSKKFDKWGVSQTYYKLGETYHRQKDYPQAGRYYQLAVSIKTQLKDYFGLIFVLGSLSDLCDNHSKFDEAIYWETEAFKVKGKIKNPTGQIDSLRRIALFYEKEGNYKKSLNYAHQAESMLKSNKYPIPNELTEQIFRLRKLTTR